MTPEFDVDRIIGRRISLGRGTEYLVLWLHYSLADATWEPTNLLDCDEKLKEFEQRCFELRAAQQDQADIPAVDVYSSYGVMSLVDEGHEFMLGSGSGFEAPPEDFGFVGDGKGHATAGKVPAASQALQQWGISHSASQRIERERRFASEALQRAAIVPSTPRVGTSDVVAHGRVVRKAVPPKAAPAPAWALTPPLARQITERQACCVCQLDTWADAWGCVECGLWFHRNCYQVLVTRLGADPEYLSTLDDYDDGDDFVCRFCSLHSRRTPQEFLTWRGTTSSNRVNMLAVDFLVKWKGVAYRHLDWVPFVWLNAQPETRKKCVSLRLMVTKTPEPPLLEDTFEQDHLTPAAIIGVKPCTPDVTRRRLAKMRDDPPVGVPEDTWGLYTAYESVWVVWRGLGASEATWEAPPNPNDAGPDYLAWYAEYVAWQQAESVSLQRHLQVAKKSRAVATAEFKQQPEFICGGTLYPYQLEGANWMWQKWTKQQSFVLADEMGLGKTVQVISFLLMIFHSTLPAQSSNLNCGTFPFLIVVPATLVSNWARELRSWAPGLVVARLSGIAGDREIELEHSIFRRTTGTKRRDLRCHVVLASYEAVAQQAGIRELTSCIKWQVIVYDEGHRLKNSLTKTYRALSVFNARMRVVLTGTPMQNDLQELFNVLSFIDPGNKEMLDKLKTLLGDGSSADLASIREPLQRYFLRRTKADVPCLVPAKHEVFVPVSMTCLQRELYRATLSKNVRLLQSIAVALHRDRQGGAGDRVGSKSLNNVLLEVRQLVSHPYLLDNVEPQFASKEETQAQLIAAGGKLRFLHALLPELRRRGHRVLVFTQFKRTLDVLEDYLAGEGIGCVRIDGDTPPLLRQAVVNQFNAPGSSLLVFLASTRTGGTGLNLTSADVVIIYDCDFNPQADIQAIGRAHRIGQTKPVIVLKLVTENSAEERIVRRATNKLLLSQRIIGNLSAEKPAAPVAVVPPMEMEADLRCDARSLFDEAAESHADDRAIVYDSKCIAALLDQCQTELAAEGARLAESGAVASSTVGVARVWTMDCDRRLGDVAEDAAEDVSVDSGAADVWARLLEQKSDVPTDGDAEMADLEGSGPRLRVRKQKVDYGAAAAEDAVDDAMDAGDDDEYIETPASPVAGATVVHPNELTAVVMAHIDGVLANYKTSAKPDGANRPINWDELITKACSDMCQPALALSEVQWTAPVLFFSTLTDLRLSRGARLPPQPKQCGICPLCRVPSHGSGYCPHICDPQLIASVARVKSFSEYWMHQAFHSFVSWYSYQYIWFVLGDPRGPAVNEQNKRVYPSYACSADMYCRNIRAEKHCRETERLHAIAVEAKRRAALEIDTAWQDIHGMGAEDGELSVDIYEDAGRNLAVSSDFRPFALEMDLGCPLYSQLLADASAQGHFLPTDVAALGPEHLPALLKARSKIVTFCLQARGIAHSLMAATGGGGRLLLTLVKAVEQVRLLALHGHLIGRCISELREKVPAADFDRIVVDTTLEHPTGALALMDVDETASDAIMAADGGLEPIAEVPEPIIAGSDSVVPSAGEFDETGGAHGVRMAVGKLIQAQCLIAGRASGTEPGEGTKRALMTALGEARTINLRELEKAAMSKPWLHGILPVVRQLAELEADPSSTEAKDAEMSATLKDLVKWVKRNICDVKSVVPTKSGYGVDIALAGRKGYLCDMAASTTATEQRRALSVGAGSPSTTCSMPLSAAFGATRASSATAIPTVPAQRAQPPPPPVTLPSTTAPITHVVQNATSAPSASKPSFLTAIAPSGMSASSMQTAALPMFSAPVVSRGQQPIQSYGQSDIQPIQIQQHPVPPLTTGFSAPVLADSRCGRLTPNSLGLVAFSSPQPLQPRPPVPAPYDGQIPTIGSSPDNAPPQQQQVCYRPALPLPPTPALGSSMSDNPLRPSTTDLSASMLAPPSYLQRPQAQFPGQRPPMAMARSSTSDLMMGLAQGYLTSLQNVSQAGVQPALLHNNPTQYPIPQQLGLHQVSSGMMRQVTPQQLAMFAQQQQQQQQQYFQSQATQLATPITGNYGPAAGQMDMYNRQLMAAAASWQMMPVSPVYVENGIVSSSSDMSCVICNDPVHATSFCPLAGNISHLTRRRMAVEESTTIPPNMRDSMLDTIDKHMRNALNQR
ncbi:hypothetical protein IW152_005873 [Coemansia sp. BCRC 34962]|nr:hypothetical protein IW152_005873 [Coemansia sp. BCRC 34962]